MQSNINGTRITKNVFYVAPFHAKDEAISLLKESYGCDIEKKDGFEIGRVTCCCSTSTSDIRINDFVYFKKDLAKKSNELLRVPEEAIESVAYSVRNEEEKKAAKSLYFDLEQIKENRKKEPSYYVI